MNKPLIGFPSPVPIPCSYNYWLLYRLPELPDPNNPPGNQLIAPVGVDELMVEDGEHYLYWYKKL